MILWYLANLIIALQIAPSYELGINSTDFLGNIIQKLDEIKETSAENAVTFMTELLQQSASIQKLKSEQERAEDTASKQVDQLRSLLEEIKESNAENTAWIRRQLSELSTPQKPQEKREASDETSDEDNLLLKEIKNYLRPFLQQHFQLSDAVQRIKSKLSKIEETNRVPLYCQSLSCRE